MEHLIGDNAQKILGEYLDAKIEASRMEKMRADAILKGHLVETGKDDGCRNDILQTQTQDDDVSKGRTLNDVNRMKDRLNGSMVWKYYGKWCWDNKTSPARKVAECSLCGKFVSAASTTNLKQHLCSAHAQKMVLDLRTDEPVPLVDLTKSIGKIHDQSKVDKYVGAKKRSLDEVC